MKRIITDEIRQGVIDNYVNKQWGQIKSGKPYGVGQKSVNKILKEANIPIRTLQEANALHRDKMKMPFNEDYFDIETPNMAYILGLIASDGNINRDRNCISIKLNSTDKEILERIRQELDMVRPIRDYITNSGQAFSDLSMSSIKVKKLLKERYNIGPNKTFNLIFPYNLNRIYWIDFIRGYFDGDGWISLHANKQIQSGICGACKDVLQTMVDYLYEDFNIPKVDVYKETSKYVRKNKEHSIIYRIVYGKASTELLYDAFYNNNNKSTLFLQRKKDKFDFLFKK